MKADPIQDYILRSEENLRIAADVREAWPRARGKIVSGFLDRLKSRLRRNLKGWTWDTYKEPFVDKWAWCGIGKRAWNEQLKVALGFSEGGKRVNFGLLRDAEVARNQPNHQELLVAVQEFYPAAIAEKWWEAKVDMRSPEPDWGKPAVLWRLHKDREFLEDVADQLLAVAAKCAPIVDKVVR